MFTHIIEIYSRIFKRNKISILLILIIYLILILSFTKFISLEFSKDEIKPFKERFYNSINKAIEKGNITPDKVKIIYNSINRDSEGLLSEYGYSNIIEDYLAENTLIEDIGEENYNVLMTIYKEEMKAAPYENLNNEQRRILNSIEIAINNKDIETSLYNLTELNEILRKNNKTISKLENQNTWSIPIAILGLLVTIVFGIMSILKPLSYAKIEEIMEGVIKEQDQSS